MRSSRYVSSLRLALLLGMYGWRITETGDGRGGGGVEVGAMGRVGLSDMISTWLFVFLLLFLLTSSFEFSLVGSIFAIVNIYILIYWFAIVPPDQTAVDRFLSRCSVGAHRGLADDAPENTLAAFRVAKELGADTVEFDLEFTQDGHAILLHDDSIDRTTDGSGLIAQTTLDQLEGVNAAAKFAGDQSRFGKVKVPSLEEAVVLLMELGLRMIIDVKNPHPLVVPTLTKLFRKHPGLYESAAVASFFPWVVLELKKEDPAILTGHTWRPGFFAYKDIAQREKRFPDLVWKQLGAEALDLFNVWFLHSWLWKLSGASLLLTQQKQISAAYASDWRAKGLTVVAWTTNETTERLWLLHHLRIPILTDRLSDFQPHIREFRLAQAAAKVHNDV